MCTITCKIQKIRIFPHSASLFRVVPLKNTQHFPNNTNALAFYNINYTDFAPRQI